jgi:hypothetical protein
MRNANPRPSDYGFRMYIDLVTRVTSTLVELSPTTGPASSTCMQKIAGNAAH